MSNYELVVSINGTSSSESPRRVEEKTGVRKPFRISTRDKDTSKPFEETYTIETDNPSVADAISHRTSSGGMTFSHLVLPNGPGFAKVTIRGNESGAEYELKISVTGDVTISGIRTGSGDWLEDGKIRAGGQGILEVELRTWDRYIPVYWNPPNPPIVVISEDGVKPDLEPHQQTVLRAQVQALQTGEVGEVEAIATLPNGQQERIQLEVIEDRLDVTGPTEVALNDSIVLEVSSTHPDDRSFEWIFVDPDQRVVHLELLDTIGKKVRITGLGVGETRLLVTANYTQLKEEIGLSVVSNIEDGIKLEASTLKIKPKEVLTVTAETRQGGEVVKESYSWTSSNPDVIVVEIREGPTTKVRGDIGGKATLTAKGMKSKLEGSLVLTVAGVEIDGPAFIEKDGQGSYEAKTTAGPNPFIVWTIDPPRGVVVTQDPKAERNTLNGLVEGAVELTATDDDGISGSKLVAVTEQPIMLLFYKPDPQNPEHPPVGPANTTIGRRDRPKLYFFATGKVKPGKYTLEIGIFGATLTPQYVVREGSEVRFVEDYEPHPFSTSFEIEGLTLGQELFRMPPIPGDWEAPFTVVAFLRRNGKVVAKDVIKIILE